MSRRARIGILIAIVGVLLAGAGIFFLSRLVTQTLAPPAAPTPIAEAKESVVIVTRDIPLGGLLNPDDLTIADYPVALIPRDALRNIEDAVGKFTVEGLSGGEVVLNSNLADPTNITHDLAFVINADQVLVSFPATDLMSSLNILQRGDLVDLFVSFVTPVRVLDEAGRQQTDENGDPLFEDLQLTFDAFQRITLSAVIYDVIQEAQRGAVTIGPDGQVVTGEEQQEEQPAAQPTNIRAYLLAMNPQDALVLKYLLDSGAKFDIALRSPNATQLFELEPVFDEYLIDRYELEIPR